MMRRALRSLLLGAALASAVSGCNASLESLGSNAHDNGGSAGSEAGGAGSAGLPSSLEPVPHSGGYYNAFASLINKQDPNEIHDKIEMAFQQLFHGNPDTEAIFQETAIGRATINDILHGDTRTEGIGLAMLITVALDHQEEFDELWRYAKENLRQKDGPATGYYQSKCGEDNPTQCFDVYGMQSFVLALMLANGLVASNQWPRTADLPYAGDAIALLDVMLNKERANGGVKMGIGSAFSADAHLVREEPALADAGYTTRSSLQMPAAYWYWAKATGNPFWNDAAQASHAFLHDAADPMTGLFPMRSYFDGTTVDGSPGYTEQAYRTQLNLALDALWGSATADQATVATHLLDFFYSQGITTYGGAFETNGIQTESNRAQALISVNGALAVAATGSAHRADFVQAVWDQPIPTGQNRYYEGLMYLTSLLILNAQLVVY
jgi:oligosaccharide reducing-end xylanase